MHFDLMAAISVNGVAGRPNDDRMGSLHHVAWVIDGATDLGPVGLLGSQGGAAWLSDTTSRAFALAHEPDLQKTCAWVFDHIETCFDAERTRPVIDAWELPKAAYAAAQLVDGTIEVAWAADCSVLLGHGTDTQWLTDAPDSSDEAADAAALGPGTGAQAKLSGDVLEDRRQHRGRANHAALSPIASANARITRFAASSVHVGDDVVLMSDGFSCLVSDYGRYDAAGLLSAIHNKGLTQLVQDIRDIEQADSACLRYPRFKVSDDCTALWIRVGG